MVKKKKFRWLVNIILLAATLVFGYFLLHAMINSVISTSQPFSSGQGNLEADLNNYQVRPDVMENLYDGLDLNQYIEGQYTILALGMDEEGLNTDVMMLVVCDLNAAKINILQIPRDTYVGPDYTYNELGKINSVYGEGSNKGTNNMSKVANCVRDMFGIPIDSYMAIKCTEVAPVVDALGGIPIDLPENVIYEADKILYAGPQTLSGEQAEWFVRFRHDYLEGDLGRIKAQRYFLAAAMQKVKDMGTLKILSIYPKIKQYIMSDLEMNEIGKLADFAQTVPMENVVCRILPGEDFEPGVINDNYGYSVHLEETVDMLNEYFRPYQEYMTADELTLTEVCNTVSFYDNDSTNFQDIVDKNGPEVPLREDANQLPEE